MIKDPNKMNDWEVKPMFIECEFCLEKEQIKWGAMKIGTIKNYMICDDCFNKAITLLNKDLG